LSPARISSPETEAAHKDGYTWKASEMNRWQGKCIITGMKRHQSELMKQHTPVRNRRDPGREATAGQSGDLQGLSSNATADSESVQELLEEGQYFEAEAVRGVEDAPDPDQGEVRTKQVPEDDVPPEYLERPDKP